ncbi:uncharacterized protein ACH125_013581 [Urocitellus parryii]
MLLPLLGACAVVGPFQGPEWEPVRGLISQDCSCRDPRCCGNLLVLCLFLIWQVRHYWHHFTRNRLRRRSIIKDSSWGAHTSHDPVFCISSFSSTCPLSQDSSWETWQEKSGGGGTLEIQTFERKNKKEPRKEEEGEIQAHGLGKQGQTGDENAVEAQTPECRKQNQTGGDPSAETEAEEGRNKDQIGNEDAVQTPTSGRENLEDVKQENRTGSQALGWGKQECSRSDNITEIQALMGEKQGQGGGENARETQASRGEKQKLSRHAVQVRQGNQGLGKGEEAVRPRMSRRKKLKEIREEDWVVIQTPWWGNQSPKRKQREPEGENDIKTQKPENQGQLENWPVLKKSKRLLLESLMRRRIAHLKWGLPRRILESYLLFSFFGSCSLPWAGVRLPELGKGQELQRQQEKHCEAQGSMPGFKSLERFQRVLPSDGKRSKLPTQARALERCRPHRSEPMGTSIPPEKPRRNRPPGGAREPQIQEEASKAKLPVPKNPRPSAESVNWCSPERVPEPSSENSALGPRSAVRQRRHARAGRTCKCACAQTGREKCGAAEHE